MGSAAVREKMCARDNVAEPRSALCVRGGVLTYPASARWAVRHVGGRR